MATLSYEIDWFDPGLTAGDDITDRSFRVSIVRGKRDPLAPIETGTCTVEFYNSDGDYDEWDTSGPFYTELKPGHWLAINAAAGTAADARLFTGTTENWQAYYQPALQASVMRLSGVDAFARLAGATLNEWAPALQQSGARVAAVLARPEVGLSGSAGAIAVGESTLGEQPVAAGTRVLDYLQQVERSEQGFMFVNRAGEVVFRNRYSTAGFDLLEFRSSGSATPPKIGVPIQQFDARTTAEDVVNRVTSAALTGGAAQTRGDLWVNTDAASVTSLRQSISYDLTDLLNATDFEADAIGEYVVDRWSDTGFRVTSVSTLLNGLSDAVAQKCLESDVGDYARVVFVGPSGATYDDTLQIIGLGHEFTPGEHRMTWYLAAAPADPVGTLFILNASSLDGPHRLGL